jgi:hypothetical protein
LIRKKKKKKIKEKKTIKFGMNSSILKVEMVLK